VLGRTLRPPAQLVLSSRTGAGNERVYIGREGWLFYRHDVEYLTNRGFLVPDVLSRRIAAASELDAPPQPDPRPAILAFHRELQAQGITLILMPTPVKPGIHPEKLNASARPSDQAIQNASFVEFTTWATANGLACFDPAPILVTARQSGPQYLATDTHWRPEAMELVAERLAAFVEQRVSLPTASPTGFTIDEREISNMGDTLAMLDLPANQQAFAQDRVLISRVLLPDGSAWRSDRAADVLLLGDSFSNIYSLASMGWGDAAGFAEHLSYALDRPLDRIVQNDDAAFATREMLRRGGAERLTGKRVVIWQFAARELASGDWKVIE
jgi:alginate O-acetyltransferase complex protein AlgJ